ncbi:MAG TPA: sigma factor-like helix-turn-helix DNA-binding protein [Terriglobales bacterium]|nr:sigma factor-like helix-turn-helix DNA-binding protein [Terriglobales bacterium]
MSFSVAEATNLNFAECLPAVVPSRKHSPRKFYERNRHRIYSLAFWMTDNELAAEELMKRSFCRAFAQNEDPDRDDVDRALIAELREFLPLGKLKLTLRCAPCDQVCTVRRNTLRVDLERAVVQLPSTEKLIFLLHDVEGYDHAYVAHLIGITEDDSCCALHQARLRLRELLTKAK